MFVIIIIGFTTTILIANDGYDLWLNPHKIQDEHVLNSYRQAISSVVISGHSETCNIIGNELRKGLRGLLGKEIPLTKTGTANSSMIIGTPANSEVVKNAGLSATLDTLGNEGFILRSLSDNGNDLLILAANEDIGLLYGMFHFLKILQTHQRIENLNIISKPKIQYRLLNHWDRLDRSVERGYAGKSLWKWKELPEKTDNRYLNYARANASIGINGTVLNNVNADANILKEEYLVKVARLADIFRPYGIKVYLSIFFSAPKSIPAYKNDDTTILTTADPLNPNVQNWWKTKVAEIYRYIPDFGGFLVKANSEGMPGPQDYDRTHADGANMLAHALAHYHGIVMWRAFVYTPEVDPDRAKRAYKEFVPLDGRFNGNVFVQAKNGPIDFQSREPVQPLFGAMPNTPLMLELQITQEYLGHSTHLVYLAPMWREYLCFDTYAKGPGSYLSKIIDGSLHNYAMTGIAGVSNIGNARNWTGHLFGQANWYAYGRLAWNHALTADEIAEEWIQLTLGNDQEMLAKIKKMMLGSWEACINYMTPLGLHHIMQEGFHYGPQPAHDRGRPDWTSVYYHRADSMGIGFDRSTSGSNAVAQYFPPLNTQFDNPETCPEKYLLWFHHVDWNKKLPSGRNLWHELCYKYYSGTAYVDGMIDIWESLENEIDKELFLQVKSKLQIQKRDAIIWRDTCLAYFQRFSQMEIPAFP
jgi:alpha-glucuronidase